MTWYNWLIVIIPLIFVMGMGIYSRRYINDVTAFLSAGRVCGRYVIAVGDIANGLSIIGVLAYVEAHYKSGFALGFWSRITVPVAMVLSLYGYCYYRFRETKAQSLGQFLEMRYSRPFRIFAATLRSLTEMLANMIMPALAARFFIYLLDLPGNLNLFGFSIPTFNLIMIVVLVLAISIICLGGAVSIIVTDTIQGFICYPLMAALVVFILWKFSWSNEILPVLTDRVSGENFLNPYDTYNLRDFNIFSMIVTFTALILHRASWIGCGGSSTAAKSPHEQKMATLLGTWRNAIGGIFFILIAIAVLVFLNHQDFAPQAHQVRMKLTDRVIKDVVKDNGFRQQVNTNLRQLPVQVHRIGTDKQFSGKNDLDTPYLNNVHKSLQAQGEAQGNSLFQQFRTLYYQQMLPVTLRNLLPGGLLGLFCLLMVLAMLSTDDSRIFSATVTIGQDIILPFKKKAMTPEQHLRMIRLVSIGIGVFFYFGSSYMAQLDYINMYTTLVCTMWMGGCGPVMIFGLYSRFGTTLGAWVSILSGMFMAVAGLVVQRNWADFVYPWLQRNDLVETVGRILSALSGPFEPIIHWRMDAVKCPINSFEWYFITMMTTLVLYCVVSWLSCRRPFNLDRMLHRGKYSLGEERVITSVWTWKNLYNKLVGITPEYSTGDKVIAWSYLIYSLGYSFILNFIAVIIWNLISPWPISWWGYYSLITFVIVPAIMAAVTAVWFSIGGAVDLRNMFRDLEHRVSNPLDDGRVEGNMSLADKASLEAVDRKSPSDTQEIRGKTVDLCKK